MFLKTVVIGAIAVLAGTAQAATVTGTFAAALTGVESSTFGIRQGSVLTNAGGIVTGTTGDMSGVALGSSLTFSSVTAMVGTLVSFTSSFWDFSGTVLGLMTSPAPNATVNLDVLGNFTPGGTLGSFVAGPASLTLGFTQTGFLVPGTEQPAISGSFTFASPPTDGIPGAVPEPASWAMLIAGFGLTGAAMRRRAARLAA